MNKTNITPAQFEKLLEMCRSFFPEYKTILVAERHQCIRFPNSGIEYPGIHWFELCITHITDKVAEEYAKQPFGTASYAKFVVIQSLFTQLRNTHPVDFLYDLWKNPQNYAQTL